MWISFVYNLSDCLTTCVSFHVRLNFRSAVTFPDLSTYFGEKKLYKIKRPKLQKYNLSRNKLELSFK